MCTPTPHPLHPSYSHFILPTSYFVPHSFHLCFPCVVLKVHADTRTLNTFLRGCVRAGDLLAARWAFGMLPRWGLVADQVAE